MNSFERKILTRLKLNPERLRTLLALPTEETVATLNHYYILESKNAYLGQLIFSLIPLWEVLACDGHEPLVKLIRLLESTRISPIDREDRRLRAQLLRLRVLAETPGPFPFSPVTIQETLPQLLANAEVLADLPLFDIIAFSPEELSPIAPELEQYQLSPLSRRYVQNLYHPERRQSTLAVLAYLAKNFPLLGTCRQSYALMLSFDEIANWSNHPFCMRLLANRFWEYRAQEVL